MSEQLAPLHLRATLIADGTSDRSLIYVLNWIISQHTNASSLIVEDVKIVYFDRLIEPPKTLVDRMQKACELEPCDILFVHRDAEKPTGEVARSRRVQLTHATRIEEIEQAFEEYKTKETEISRVPRLICVVPVRMMEAWLLCDEQAIRKASGNPKGQASIRLPSIKKLETIPDPKIELHTLIKTASGLQGRRLKQLNVYHAENQVAQFINDFSMLRGLYAFGQLETAIKTMLESISIIDQTF